MTEGENKTKSKLNKQGKRTIIGGILSPIVGLIILLVSAGKFFWINAWLYTSVYFFLVAAYAIIMVKKNPELLNERGKSVFKKAGKFDKIYFGTNAPLNLVFMVLAGFDATRFKWSSMPGELSILGVIITVPAFLFTLWAMSVNNFFDATVRIQTERNHEVCMEGPYKLVRHPGYSGTLFTTLATPLILGSWWCFVPCIIMFVMSILRTGFEDNFLRKKLQGYSDYIKIIRYRLIPYVW